MRKSIFIFPLGFVLFIFLVSAQMKAPSPVGNNAIFADETELDMPEDVHAVLDKACFDCHHERSGNLKAKGKLNFSKWDKYKDTKKIGKLEEICGQINSGEMPPKKYKEKYPENTPTEEDAELVCKWTKEQQDLILGE